MKPVLQTRGASSDIATGRRDCSSKIEMRTRLKCERPRLRRILAGEGEAAGRTGFDNAFASYETLAAKGSPSADLHLPPDADPPAVSLGDLVLPDRGLDRFLLASPEP